MSPHIGTATVKIKADTTEYEAAVAGLNPSDYTIRLDALDRALCREHGLGGGLDIIKTAHRYERFLRGVSADE